jgi:hypothetical protein
METAELGMDSLQSHRLVGMDAFNARSRRIGGAVDEKSFPLVCDLEPASIPKYFP